MTRVLITLCVALLAGVLIGAFFESAYFENAFLKAETPPENVLFEQCKVDNHMLKLQVKGFDLCKKSVQFKELDNFMLKLKIEDLKNKITELEEDADYQKAFSGRTDCFGTYNANILNGKFAATPLDENEGGTLNNER
jgi:hypothetical protein